MKNSGIEWIGEIPDDWETKTIKQLLIERTEKNSNYQTDTILSLSAKDGVSLYDGEHHAGNRPREDLSDYKVVYPDDIVVNSMNILSGSVGLSKFKGCVSPVYYIYYPRKNNNVKFLHYIFQCKQFQLSLRGLGKGILIKETESGALNTIRTRISSQSLAMQKIPSCECVVQQKIADYLDKKCAAVDKLIENQRAQIEKLKEYKQSVITEAVTKGLDPSVPLKDSGLKFGMIPCHWCTIQFKNVAKLANGREVVSTEGNIPVYGSGGIFKYTDNYLYDGVSLLMGRKGTIDNPMLVSGKFWTVDTMFYTSEIKNILPKFLYYLVCGIVDYGYYKSGSVLPSMTQTEINNIRLTYPPFEEQKQIAEYLDKKCGEIDRLIAIKQKKIETLAEYKKSLIYEYVTGKKQVA